ncbi:DUF2750 domain-containing protein [Microbacterium sp. NPDC056569]|uniref:DUF2750 domain-containing protein n=1 Tax=Microbacterium sp. NPDC056569 TaxID=3345867 RepID=UPI00366F1E9B
MSTSAAQAAAFFTELGADGSVWTIEDDAGIPAPVGATGERAMPFWSRKSRALSVIATAPAYAGFRPRQISRAEFESRWLPGLAEDGLLIGVNWAGERATGYELSVDDFLARLPA